MTTRFAEIIELKRQLDDKLKTFGKDAIAEAFAPFFAANRDVDGVCWSQYTPYFNDGDSCEFGVHEPSIILTLAAAKAYKPEADWSEYSTARVEEKPLAECTPEELRTLAEAKESASDMLPEDEYFGYNNPRCFESWDLRDSSYNLEQMGFDNVWGQIPEEVFESVFGDHVEVRIMRDGTVEVTECEHD